MVHDSIYNVIFYLFSRNNRTTTTFKLIKKENYSQWSLYGDCSIFEDEARVCGWFNSQACTSFTSDISLESLQSYGSMSITAYYTKYKTLIDELESLTTRPKCDCHKCTCEINNKLSVYDLNIQLMQFLMGLSDVFTSIRGQILLMSPIPTLSQCYAMLMQDENQRDVHNLTGMNSSTVAMNVKSNMSGRFLTKGVATSTSQNSGASGKRNASDSSLVCEFCHMTGHSKDRCFCVVGYPSWHRLFGKPKPKPRQFTTSKPIAAQVAVHTGDTVSSSVANNNSENAGSMNFGLSESQYKHLIQMLQNSMQSTGTATASPNWASANTVHIAGPYLEEGTRDW